MTCKRPSRQCVAADPNLWRKTEAGRMNGFTTIVVQVCVLLGVLLPTAHVAAQGITKVRIADKVWGFDGRVMTGQFMPLSIELDNLSDEPIEAQATLKSVAGMIRDTGGTATQSVFLSPHSRRWVQFYPFIFGMTTSWRFELRTAEETFTFDPIDQPRSVFEGNSLQMPQDGQSLPAVILDRPGAIVKIPTTVKHMPEEIFPPYSTATHGLYALFMDHVPDWETPRQEALLSWLKAGGRLHLLQDQNNQTLRFSGPLAPLNDPFVEFHVGSGNVTRHDFQRDQLSKDIVTTVVTPPGLSESELAEVAKFNETNGNSTFGFGSSVAEDEELFYELRQLTQPKHMWWLIFLLSLCYVGLIFPGCWVLSRQRTLHFLVTYGAIAGLAAVFSLMFLFIGRRGYGESTCMHSAAIARCEDDTHCSLLQMTTLFVTDGNTYSIDDKDHQTLLASGTSEENVDALITSGNTASFVSRIPPYSSQAVRSRRRLPTENWELAITSLKQQADELTELTVAFGEKFPEDSLVKCEILHRNRIHNTKIDRSSRRITLRSSRELLRVYCAGTQYFTGGGPIPMLEVVEDEPDDPVEACFQRMLPGLVRRSLLDDCANDIARFRLPEDRIRLLIYAPMSDQQQLQVNAEVRRIGRILYVRDLLINANRSATVIDEEK